MRIELRVDRVIVDETLLPVADGPALRRALTDELAAVLHERLLTRRQTHRDRLDAGTVELARAGPGDLGWRVARAVHDALDGRTGPGEQR